MTATVETISKLLDRAGKILDVNPYTPDGITASLNFATANGLMPELDTQMIDGFLAQIELAEVQQAILDLRAKADELEETLPPV